MKKIALIEDGISIQSLASNPAKKSTAVKKSFINRTK
jgi:hypothetical protein